VIGRGRMLHIEVGTQACIEAYMGLTWRNRIVGFWRHPELEAQP
jgi:hypothetical protein